MKNLMKKGGLLLAILLASNAKSQCTINLTQNSTKMVGVAWGGETRKNAGVYLRQVGTSCEVDVINHKTGTYTANVLTIPNYSLVNVNNRIVSGNFDYDGGDNLKDDIAIIYKTGTNTYRVDVLRGIGSAFTYNQVATATGNPDLWNGRVVAGTFYANQNNDRIAVLEDNGGFTSIDIIAINFSGSNFTGITHLQSEWSSFPSGYTAGQVTNRVVCGDFDRDGWDDDIAAFYDYGNSQTRIHVWTTGSFYNQTITYQGGAGWWGYGITGYTAGNITSRVTSGDFDRDGKLDDIAVFYDYGGGAARAHVFESTGSSFQYANTSNGYWQVPSGYSLSPINNKIVSINQKNNGLNKESDLMVLYNYGSATPRYHHFKAHDPVGGGQEYFTYHWVNFCSSREVIETVVDEENLKIEKLENTEPSTANSKNLEDQKNSTLVYPNPVSDNLTIQLSSDFLNSNLHVYVADLSGKIIMNEVHSDVRSNKLFVNFEAVPQGFYLVKIVSSNGLTETYKITKK